MAVTESKGDGYALYNGVKLPNIDTVWTEELKAQYPYATISKLINESTVESVGFEYVCVIAQSAPSFVETGYDVFGSANMYALISGCWQLYQEENEHGFAVENNYQKLIWTFGDSLNSDGSVHLSASDPIPLDGMNVIEWDGDTTGLVNIEGFYFKVSNTSLSIEEVIESHQVQILGGGALSIETISDSDIVASNEYAIAAGAMATCSKDKHELEGTIIPEAGLYFLRNNEEMYTALLAYTPAATEEPEEPDTSSLDRTSLLIGWLVGRRMASKKIEITTAAYCLYNGVKLPNIDTVWTDKVGYPYVYITKIDYSPFGVDAKNYVLRFTDSSLTWNGEQLEWNRDIDGNGSYSESELQSGMKCGEAVLFTEQSDIDNLKEAGEDIGEEYVAGVWKFEGYDEMTGETTAVSFGGSFLWSNHDTLNTDGSVYFPASDPVPVYE